MRTIEGKIAFITGSASGIGFAISKRLAQDGAVLAMTDRDQTALKEAFDKIQGISPKSHFWTMDVTNQEGINKTVKSVIDTYGVIDILVNNAGVSTMNRFTDLTEDEWDLNMNVNLKGVWRVTKEIAPFMIQRKSGKIICTASMASKLGAPFLAHYSASKFGVLGFVQAIAKELAEYGITVNAVCPGYVATSMQDREVVWEAKLRGIDDPEKVRQEYITMTPLKRLCMPEDVANVVSFLASPDADFMTGQGINVTGGACVH
ncbi:MAG: SDR family NAD(P)-dependent oxidoreductase [Rectinema subterraneum]|jgi:meso-butanediol dehydrogenase/(S,S)-butanediol dehydrogenase/diacetyl reductase|uniref:SDR family NAD(P)-dependent oxidoreductase n=1 Tax=Rectinema subterraneum TaxID=2653714 RepID=UPI003C7B05F2